MLEELAKELDKFLIVFSVTGQGVFFDWVAQKAKLASGTTLSFAQEYHERAESIYLEINKMPLEELYKVLDFFNIPQKNYTTNKVIKLDNTFVFEVLLPKFKEDFLLLTQEEPLKLRRYQISSQVALESNVIEKIKKLTLILIESLHKSAKEIEIKESEIKETELNELLHLFFALKGIFSYQSSNNSRRVKQKQELQVRDSWLDYLLQAEEKINLFLNAHLDLALDKTLIGELTQAFQDFKKYNRFDKVQHLGQFRLELEEWLNQKKISGSQCDIFEETLLKMAGVHQMPEKCTFDTQLNDRTRLFFTFESLADEEAEKFLKLFRDYGDDTASWNGKYLACDYGFAPDMVEQACYLPCYEEEENEKVKEDFFSIDGETFIQKIFEDFKTAVSALEREDSELFQKYQKQSENYLQKNKKTEVIKLSTAPQNLFYHGPALEQTVTHTEEATSASSTLNIGVGA